MRLMEGKNDDTDEMVEIWKTTNGDKSSGNGSQIVSVKWYISLTTIQCFKTANAWWLMTIQMQFKTHTNRMVTIVISNHFSSMGNRWKVPCHGQRADNRMEKIERIQPTPFTAVRQNRLDDHLSQLIFHLVNADQTRNGKAPGGHTWREDHTGTRFGLPE